MLSLRDRRFQDRTSDPTDPYIVLLISDWFEENPFYWRRHLSS